MRLTGATQKFQWGFIGAPIAVVVTDNLLPLLLFMYVFFIDGRECWPGLTRRALCNWGPMIRLALPGLVMVEAECLAFEILTLAASYLGTTQLAAQSVLSTLLAIAFQIPFPISVASSTRIANLVGATLSDAAQTSIKVALIAACGVGIFNTVILFSLRDYIPYLFTNDSDVVAMVSAVLPLCAAFQLFDALAAICNGILRGIGRQEIGGWVNLSCYYLVGVSHCSVASISTISDHRQDCYTHLDGYGFRLALGTIWTMDGQRVGIGARGIH